MDLCCSLVLERCVSPLYFPGSATAALPSFHPLEHTALNEEVVSGVLALPAPHVAPSRYQSYLACKNTLLGNSLRYTYLCMVGFALVANNMNSFVLVTGQQCQWAMEELYFHKH